MCWINSHITWSCFWFKHFKVFFLFKTLQPLKFVWLVIYLPEGSDLSPSSMSSVKALLEVLISLLVLLYWQGKWLETSLLKLFTKFFFFFFPPVLLQVVQGIRKNKKLLFCLRILLLDKVLIYSLFLYKIPLERGNNVESLAGCFYLLTFCFLIYTDIKCEGLIFDCHIVF